MAHQEAFKYSPRRGAASFQSLLDVDHSPRVQLTDDVADYSGAAGLR